MKKDKVIGLIATTLIGGAMLSACGNSNTNPLWIVNEGFNESQEGSYGMLYLNSLNYDFYQYQQNGWALVDNLADEVGVKKDASISIDEKGNWAINDKSTSYKSYGKDDVFEYLTKIDYYSQASFYGTQELATKKSCTIAFSLEMMKDTLISFKESTDLYNYQVGEIVDGQISFFDQSTDNGWTDANHYVLKEDSFPVINVSRVDNKEMTQDERMGMHTIVNVKGVKVTKDYSETLTEEEYLTQVAHFGSVPSPTYKTRIRMSFSIRLERGATVRFLGNLTTYKWAVVEMFDVASDTGYLDSGWSSAWSQADKTQYKTKLDGTYIVITLTKNNGGNFVSEDFLTMHEMFEVEGTKYNDSKELEQRDEYISSTAHRGFSYRGPENTLAAYRMARKYGFKKAECDVKFTKDNVPVLLHDDTIDRTSNGTGTITNMTFEEVRQYDFGSWKGKEFIGEKIPTFEEFIALCKELNLHPYIELKSNVNAEQAQMLVDIVNKYDYLSDVSWISFDFNSLKEIGKIDEEARLGYTQSSITTTVINNCGLLKNRFNEVYVNVANSSVNATTSKMVKDAGFPLEVWTVNSIDDLLNLDPYVTGIASDWINASYVLDDLK